MNELDLMQFIQENWQVGFLYGLKYLKDMSRSHTNLEKIVAVHEAEIEMLKKNKG
ncbi:hypothetical protein [uncultured Arcobacter sp.]|uniref:hypothetical protein n=1 Tax=uncultured Arcobacter sp. TaxID=165434 RepID=UPI00261D88FE|nr:hypothetical protein [uncultured Arcobacter sp.]